MTFWEQTPHLFLYHGAPTSNEVCSAPISPFPPRNCGTFALNYMGGIILCCSLKIKLPQHCWNWSLCVSVKLALRPSVRVYIEGYRAIEQAKACPHHYGMHCKSVLCRTIKGQWPALEKMDGSGCTLAPDSIEILSCKDIKIV